MGRISTRLIELQRLIQGKGVSLDEENQRLLDSVEELGDDAHSLSEKLEKAYQTISKYEDAAEEVDDEKEELLSMINGALSTVYHETFDDLESAVRALIGGYLDAMEEAEEQV